MDEFESMDVLQRDVMYDTMFSVVMHRVLSAMGYCVVRFDDMSRMASEVLWGMVYCRVLKCGVVFFVVLFCGVM